MRFFVTLIPVLVLLVSSIPAYALYYDFDTTDANSSVLVRDSFLAGRHWGQGDEIAVMNQNNLCAGASVVNRFPLGIAAWGDDALTEEIDGFVDGDTMHFVAWDASAEQEFMLSQVFILEGDLIWHSNGLVILDLADEGLQFMPHPTYDRHSLTCLSVTFTFDDVQFSARDLDQIGIFTPDSVVAGVLVWNGETEMAEGWIFGDNLETEEAVEGMVEGEAFRFAYWIRESDTVYAEMDIEFVEGDQTFRINGETTVRLSFTHLNASSDLNPREFRLTGPYPNPFNGIATIGFYLPSSERITLAVYDASGRKLSIGQDLRLSAGTHKVSLNFEEYPAGVYYGRVKAGNTEKSVEFHLIK